MSCRNNHGGSESREKHLGAGVQCFHLPPGCVARFSEHRVYSDMTLKMPAETLHFELAWSSTKMFSQPSAEIDNELSHLQNFGIYNPDLTSLGLVMSTSLSTWISNVKIVSTVIFILVLLLSSIMCLNCYKHYRRLPREPGEDSGISTPPFGLQTPHTSSEQMNENEELHQATSTTAHQNPPEMTTMNRPRTS